MSLLSLPQACWTISTGKTSTYGISTNQMQDGRDGHLFWQPKSFAADQEAYVTLTQVDTGIHDPDRSNIRADRHYLPAL
jgi:hypothetical protein